MSTAQRIVRVPQAAGVKRSGGGRFVAGFAGELHIPKGGIFAISLLSGIFTIGTKPTNLVGRITIKVARATPNMHGIIARMQNEEAIAAPL